jgi:predicted RNase H-like nuclease (RuvC/YqgF family)
VVEWWCLPLALAAGAALHAILEEPKPEQKSPSSYSDGVHIRNLESDVRNLKAENSILRSENDSLRQERESLRSVVIDGVVMAIKR